MAEQENLKKINASDVSHQAYADILGQLNATETRYLEAYARWKDKNDYMREHNVNKPLIDRCFAEILNIGMNSIGRYGLNAYNVTSVIGYSVILMSQGADMKRILSMKVADMFERPVARMLQRERVRAESYPEGSPQRSKYEKLERLHNRILQHSSETTMFYTPKSAALELTANEMHYFNAVRQPGITPADVERLKLENEERRNSLYERLNESGVDLDELQKETIKIQTNLILQQPKDDHPAWATRFQLFDYDPDSETLKFHNVSHRFVGRAQVKKYVRYYDTEGNEVIHPENTDGLIEREINPINDDGIIDKTATIKYEMSNVYDVPDEMMFDENGYIDPNLIRWARPIYSEYDYNNMLKIFLRDNFDKLNDQTEDTEQITNDFKYLLDCAETDGISNERMSEMFAKIAEDMQNQRANGGAAPNPEAAATNSAAYEDENGDMVYDIDPSVYFEDDDDDYTVEEVADTTESKQISEETSTVDMSDIEQQAGISSVPEVSAEEVTETPSVSELKSNISAILGGVTVENVEDRVNAKVMGTLETDENFIQNLDMTPAAFRGRYTKRFEPVENVPRLDTNEEMFDRVCTKYDELCHLRGYYPYEGIKHGETYTKDQRQNNIDQIKSCMYENGVVLAEMHGVLVDVNSWTATIDANRQMPTVSATVMAKAKEISDEYGKGSDFANDLEFLEQTILPRYHRGNIVNSADMGKVYDFTNFLIDKGVLSPDVRDPLYEQWVKQQSEFINDTQIFEVKERKERFMRQAHEDEVNGIPRLKIDETVDEKVAKAEDNPLSEKNMVEVGKAVAEDKAFDTLADKLTSEKVDAMISDAVADISGAERSVADEFVGEIVADGFDEAVGAGATLAVHAIQDDATSGVQPTEQAKHTGRIKRRSEKIEERKQDIEQAIKKSKGSRRKKDVNEALEAAEKVNNAPSGIGIGKGPNI